MAIVAAGALVLSGCTSDSGDDGDDTTSADSGDAGGGTDGDDSTATGGSEGGEAAGGAKPDLGDVTTADDNIFYSAGEVEWSGYNGNLIDTNSTYNAVINARLNTGFQYFGSDGSIIPDTDFGSYEVTSEDPLIVEYTISDEAVWEDGTPITYDDYLYDWASNNAPAIFGEDADPVFNNVSSSFGEYVPEGPQGEPGGKTFTVEYESPYPDWEILIGGTFPAHIVAEQSGMTLEELTQAITDRDAEAVGSTADFFNEGWLSPDKQLPDPAIVPSSGPYSLNGATWSTGEYITLVPNENWWGTPAATANLTFRFAAAETHVTALANGDLNVIEPQATVDTITQIEELGDQFTLLQGDTLTWEHLDFNFAEDSPFADGNGGLAAREAFAMCVPRQQIVDNLITPINPEAVVMNAREKFPFQDDYQEVVDAAYDGRFDEVDLEGAKAKLAESGLETPVPIRIGYSAPNQRRTNEVSLIASSCNDPELFEVEDVGNADFFGTTLENGDWEIALFAWAGSGQIASGQAIYETDGEQNFGGFSNEEVDAAWDELASTVDPAVHLEQVKIIEKALWENLYGIPLFAHPGVVAHDATIDNIIFNSTQTQIVWNAEQWVRAQ
ncbi:ABC transporter substrate-binding protein [Ornithinicoccus hortensis]|uniref:Peptide/nickel transport system substrate-binding protein n=2 Tax=Ornithinicoccus hortensis TaxID=82346 RepID=A0A542YSH2_9MICO|nr:peptide/nickel transport system substrate-binding protein [Ornithinicoccus hortensis]